MIIWIVGLSAVGKTEVGKRLLSLVRKSDPATVLVDGDEIRSMFAFENKSTDYSIASRKLNSSRMVAICKWLDQQKMNVICCKQCIFDEIMIENHSIFSSYKQIELVAPLETLVSRDPKGIYSSFYQGEISNVVGLDIEYNRPSRSDLVIDTSTGCSPDEIASQIMRHCFPDSDRLLTFGTLEK